VYPRWHLDEQNPPPTSGAAEAVVTPAPRSEFVRAPIDDLERQLAAELDGASWAVVAFTAGDAPWCDWLHRNLNGYPVPAELIERATPHGFPRPNCISVFPDLRDPEFEARYAHALETSGYLIVVCSPEAARSPELEEKIRAFKTAGGEERIIALVVESDPHESLETLPKTGTPDWLPAWLCWRLDEDAFVEAERVEPRIIDARPGRAPMKAVRDAMLSALLEKDAVALDALGAFSRPVEFSNPEPDAGASMPCVNSSASSSPSTMPPAATRPPGRKRRDGDGIGAIVAVCAGVIICAAWSLVKQNDARNTPASPIAVAFASFVKHQVASTEPAPDPGAQVAEVTPPEPPTPAPPLPVAPPQSTATPISIARVVPTPQPPPSLPPTPEIEPPERGDDAIVHAAFASLHRRGDAAFAQRRLEEALDLYAQAADTARDSAARSSVDAKAEAALVCRKLGTLQLQLASTSEARASFALGRKMLLQVKAHGGLNNERTKLLGEIEKNLRALPRD
jgi:hypothetical protein